MEKRSEYLQCRPCREAVSYPDMGIALCKLLVCFVDDGRDVLESSHEHLISPRLDGFEFISDFLLRRSASAPRFESGGEYTHLRSFSSGFEDSFCALQS